ncbi:hypothetical protein [Aquipseudomonas guryensis]|jgi:hypothetical protein|uniref:DUF1269 domain-containing protein n=1 Tax=Aquipseudomonas guryensis TaxID=2759165 RepID=A0A7W4DEV6_9GAMM|nr:hypothetical protein [Pseudomonas guryensis]MBB1521263.1 hypothetical protein [Pseudomonas guryensis]
MDRYCHNVSGFFPQRAPAESTLAQLIQRGLHNEDLQIFTGDGNAPPAPTPQRRSNGVLKDMLVVGAIGAGIGIGLGAAVEMMLIVNDINLFSASPLLAPLMLLGWGAFIGAFLGSAIGAARGPGAPGGRFTEMISGAITQGDVVLVAKTYNEQETAIAREVIKASAGEYKDIDMVITPREVRLE